MTGAAPEEARPIAISHASRWAAVLVSVYILSVLPSLGQSLLETHAYRQTQTAYTAVLYAERGINLLQSPLPILGPPGYLPLEFPLFQAIGALIMELGVNADAAMRIAGLGSFVLAAALVFSLTNRLLGSVAALAAMAAFMFNAHAWLYGRTSLIEYLAAAGGIGFLLFGVRWADDRHRADWFLAALFGAVGVLVKITTGAFYLLPLLLWHDRTGQWGFRRLSVWALILGCCAIGGAWSLYADSVRATMPATEFLATQNQLSWLFGDLTERLDVGAWRTPLVAMLMLTGSAFFVWGPIAVIQARRHSQGPFLSGLLATVVAVPLILFNLYAIHDYYYAAIAPVIALGIGLGVDWLSNRIRTARAKRLTVVLATAWLATIIGTAPTWGLIYQPPIEKPAVERIVGFIRDHSDSDDWVVLDGWGWNSTFFYYARRQGFAIPDDSAQDTSGMDMDAILADPTYGPFIVCDRTANCEVTHR